MTTTIKKHPALFSMIATAIVILSLIGFAQKSHANPLGFFRTSSVDGLATTSLAFQTAGTGTTTKYYDTGSGNNFSADKAVFALQQTGSSTGSILKTEFEFANPPTSGANCTTNPNACDWYKDSTTVDSGISTTSQAANITTSNSFTMTFASTSPGGAGGSSARMTRLITVPTYTRYIRAVITTPVGSTNNGVWGEFIGKKQTQ